jgi:hypothetical protein
LNGNNGTIDHGTIVSYVYLDDEYHAPKYSDGFVDKIQKEPHILD